MPIFLAIDDSDIKLKLLEGIFKAIGAEIITKICDSVKEALQAIEEYKPDVIFLDHHLTSGGNEGFKILEIIFERSLSVRIYSTTEDIDARDAYIDIFKIEVVSLRDTKRVMEIVANA